MQGLELAKHISQLVLDKRGYDIVIQDLSGLTSVTDYFIVCTADSDVQVKAIMDHIKDELVKTKIKPWHAEGQESLTWVLLDFIDVVVHIFQKETREFYALERLWGDAPVIEVKDEHETPNIHTNDH